jgi:hypothetical protein
MDMAVVARRNMGPLPEIEPKARPALTVSPYCLRQELVLIDRTSFVSGRKGFRPIMQPSELVLQRMCK